MGEIKQILVSICFTALAIFSVSSLGQTAIFAQRDIPVAFNLSKLNLERTYDYQKGMYITEFGSELKQMDIFLGELETGTNSEAMQHIYEEMVYVLEGKGHTLVWKDNTGDSVRLDWEEGDLISPPLNFHHKHYNDSSSSVKLLYVTTKPLSQVFFNKEFLTNADYSFNSIWEEYSSIVTPVLTGNSNESYVEMKAGFLVKDIDDMDLPEIHKGHNAIGFLPGENSGLAGNRLFEVVISSHNASDDLPYKRHPWEIVFFVLDGDGGAIVHMPGGPPDRLEFEKNELFYTRSNKWNWLGSLEDSEYRILEIKPTAYFRNSWDVIPVINQKPGGFNEFFR